MQMAQNIEVKMDPLMCSWFFSVVRSISPTQCMTRFPQPHVGRPIGGADVTVKKIPTPIKIILLKKIRFYSESN